MATDSEPLLADTVIVVETDNYRFGAKAIILRIACGEEWIETDIVTAGVPDLMRAAAKRGKDSVFNQMIVNPKGEAVPKQFIINGRTTFKPPV